MSRVAYDITALAESPYGGVAQVSFNTLQQAVLSPRIDPIGYYRHGRADNVGVGDAVVKKCRLLDRYLGERHDIVHSLCHRRLPVRAARDVYTVHDAWSLKANPYQSPEFQKKVGARMRREILAADHIITVSQTTKEALVELDLVSEGKCTVAYNGFSRPASGSPAEHPPSLLPLAEQPYALFVGRLEVRKNIGHLLTAVEPLGQVHLVIAGQPGYGYREQIKPRLAGFPSERLHVVSKIDRAGLQLLYGNAIALLLPSWEEGFGLPILEAMGHGCPVITSNRSANAEVAGDAAALIDPDQPVQSRQAIERLIEDGPYRKSLISRGLKRAGQFTWEGYFARLVEVYDRVLLE